ncbi:MAG: DUF2809 domain-containing protein [Pseudomonadota bacterium]
MRGLGRKTYALGAIILFAGLAAIALYAEGSLRTHGGDALVVVWMYCCARALTLWPMLIVALLVFAAAVAIETSQALGLAERLGIDDDPATQLIIGHRFDPVDLLMYALGAVIALGTDYSFSKGQRP